MGVETHKVEVVPVRLEPHPNADRLSVVRVYNFTVCVNTADWQGVEKAAYVQPDSVMPDTPEYRFLKDTAALRKEREELEAKLAAEHESDLCRLDYDEKSKALEAKIDANTKHLRITVRKLRGVISMGMLIPVPPCEHCAYGAVPVDRRHEMDDLEGTKVLCTNQAQIGDDIADALGITHYDPPPVEERYAGDDVASAPPMVYAPKYDVESVYKYAGCFEAGEPVYVSEKLDGQNARFVTTWGEPYVEDTPGGQRKQVTPVNFHAGSRTEWKKEEGGSNWWKVLRSNLWLENWVLDNPDLVVYGEVFGWVQSLRYGAKPGELFFRAFDIMEGTKFWDAEKFVSLPREHRVPDLGVMPFDFEKLQALADGPSLIKGANHMREGIVIKPLRERQHPQLGRVMVKMVSNAYLEKSAR
jgi:RNA ligase (TIGR02306 family)